MKTKTIHINTVGILSFETPIANGLAILAGSTLIAVLAQISIHVPFSPVPITGQTIGVILVGGLLGRKRGVLAVAAYLCEGAIRFTGICRIQSRCASAHRSDSGIFMGIYSSSLSNRVGS